MAWCFSCFTKTYEAPEVLELDYRHSTLTEVPPEVFTFERTLEKLHLSSNQISDLPPSLFHCHGLKELDLCDNDLTVLPAAIGSLSRLWRLDLSRNAISEVSDSIKNCKSLTHLDLSLNHLIKLPEGVSQLVNLEELFLNDTYLEFLHANFGRLTKLKVLELRENSIQSLPKSMARLTHLQRLDVGQNDLFEFPEVIGTMTGLTELWCDNNNIRSLSKVIGSLGKLNCLDASSNEIREIADEICRCTQLVDVTLAMNNLESLPDTFPKLENLTVLRLEYNSIQYLPEDFGHLKSLQELSLIRNLLKALPPSFGLLRKLHTLYLDDNLLPELPKEIGSCISLTVLSVSKNRLTSIPSEFGHLSSLKVLALAGNHIVNLPVSILNIPQLWALWLSESQTKPLLQLNQEIDPRTGQHVLTCFLLPQMPYTSPELTNGNGADESMEGATSLPPRRSRPSIKFVTDNDPPVIDNNVNKRGLLRAPTPYPKELRALAKHASHLRQSRENGDVPNTDEPEYEGDDYNEDDDMETDRAAGLASGKDVAQRTSLIGGVEVRTAKTPMGTYYNLPQRDPYEPSKLTQRGGSSSSDAPIGLPDIDTLPGGRSSYSRPGPPGPGPQVAPPPIPVETIISKIEESNKRSAEKSSALGAPISLTEVILPDSTSTANRDYGSSASELARKSPPPYHVAARRAAFFRSSVPSTTSSVVPPPSSPRLTPTSSVPPPLPVSEREPSALYIPGNQNQNQNSRHSEDDVQTEPSVRTPLLNRTYVIESSDAKETNSSVLELTDVLGLKSVETKSETEKSSARVMSERGLEKEKWLREKSVIESIVKSASEVGGNLFESTTTTSNVTSETMTTTTTQESEGLGVDSQPSSLTTMTTTTTTGFPRSSYSSGLLSSSASLPKSPTASLSSSTRIPVFATTAKSPIEERNSASHGTGIPTSFIFGNSQPPSLDLKSSNPTPPPTPPPKPPVPVTAETTTTTGLTKVNNSSASRIPKIPSSFSGSNLNNINNKTSTTTATENTNLSNSSKDSSTMNNNNGTGISKLGMSRTVTPTRIPSMSESRGVAANTNKDGTSRLPALAPKPNLTSSTSGSKIPKPGEVESRLVKRTTSGSKIPMSSKKAGTPPPQSLTSMDGSGDSNSQEIHPNSESADGQPSSPQQQESQLISNSGIRKPWIFGTHKNPRVMNLEHTKSDGLGFSIIYGIGGGIYVDKVDAKDSKVEVADKILQVDGIDVVNMQVDIVRKILGNCQDTFNLLVCRQCVT